LPFLLIIDNHIIVTVAGNGSVGHRGDGRLATLAELSFPLGMAVDSKGNTIFADIGTNLIRKIDFKSKIITTVAGKLSQISPQGYIALDSHDNIYFSEPRNSVIRMINATDYSKIFTVAGNRSRGHRYECHSLFHDFVFRFLKSY
jgi:hypothetical protein